MRIACVHIPQFALQCVTRIDPSLRGEPVCVVGAGGPESRPALGSPVVMACSRAAWALGVRLGMTAASARLLSPDLRIIPIDFMLERETTRAIADVLLSASKLVDIGGRIGMGAHLAVYCEVPVKTRGGSFGDRLIDLLDGLGLTARIGIADDRFTAWVAASQPLLAHATDEAAHHHGRHASARPTDRSATRAAEPGDRHGTYQAHSHVTHNSSHPIGQRDHDVGVVTVPRGGSAAFLAPMPLSLLAISIEVQHMLESLGVTNLGEFAALPAPTVARPIDRVASSPSIDYQALARGESGNLLRPYAPEAPIVEHVVASEAVSSPAATALLAQRIAMRLDGRERGAARLEISASGPDGERILPLDLHHQVLTSPSDIADALAQVIDGHTIWRLRATVTGEALVGEPTHEQLLPVVEAEHHAAQLSVALAGTGSGDLFRSIGLAPPATAIRNERRDAHMRKHQGPLAKRRRRALMRAGDVVQPRLFSSATSGHD